MSDTWNELQQVKIKRLSLRKKLALRKKNRDGIIAGTSIGQFDLDARLERFIQDHLMDPVNQCTDSLQLMDRIERAGFAVVDASTVHSMLLKLAVQGLISVRESTINGSSVLQLETFPAENQLKSAADSTADCTVSACRRQNSDDVLDLLELPSAREKQNKLVGDEIVQLLSRPTVRERQTAEHFRSQGGTHLHEYCRYGTRQECQRNRVSDSGNGNGSACDKVHFIKIVQAHTDETLGDCSFLNTCFHIKTCRYVHYEVDSADIESPTPPGVKQSKPAVTTPARTLDCAATASDVRGIDGAQIAAPDYRSALYPPQWIQCDLRVFDMTVIGECAVIMADPPWDIHMELPYGTLSDDEMRNLSIPSLQKSGLFFLWVTGRAMELGRECLQLWGYERVDELIWVKTNQLQRIIRTGRTGHWLNHGKEHCLVGMKGDPSVLNRGLDSDVLVAEVRATSHKPDEIYGIIERLSPGTRKLELFGRPHNAQPNWITLGNQLDGVNLCDPEILQRFNRVYPGGDAMKPATAC